MLMLCFYNFFFFAFCIMSHTNFQFYFDLYHYYSFIPQFTFICLSNFSFGKIFISFIAASIVHLSTKIVWLIFVKANIIAMLNFAFVIRDQLLFFYSFGDIILCSLFNLLWNVLVHLCAILHSWNNLFKLSLGLLIKKKNAYIYFSLKENTDTIQNVYDIVLTLSQTIEQMGTHRQQTVQTQGGTEILQIKKCFKLDCLKAL